MRDKSHPFDRLFDELTRDYLFRDMKDIMQSPQEMQKTVSEGRRVERVNGETTEYYLDENGEWQEVEEDRPLDFSETENGYRLTVDASQYLPVGNFETSASVNNGVVEVSFKRDEE